MITRTKRFAAFGAVALFVMSTAYAVWAFKAAREAAIDPRQAAGHTLSYQQLMVDLQQIAARFPGSVGIVVRDLRTGESVEINADTLMPSASLVKVPIMAACHQAQAEGALDLDDRITLLKRHKIRDCSQLYRVRCGTAVPVRGIIERMITESDNTATNMLVDRLGFQYLNEKFSGFGLMHTDLRRGVMDLKWRKAGIENYTTARDMAFILEKIYRGELVSPQASAEMLDVLRRQKVNDRIPRLLPGGVRVAHKTGLLRDTVSDVGIVFTPRGDFIVAVITADIPNYRIAKRFIGRVAATAYDRCYRPG